MIEIMYKPHDLRYIFLYGDDHELRSCKGEKNKRKNLEDFLNLIPSYQFLPSFSGIPKPECFLHKFKSSTGQTIYYCHSGLWKTIYDWCQANNIKVKLPDNFDRFKYTNFDLTLEEFKEYIESWEISLNPYPYQLKAAWLILKYNQSLSQLATRAGKTLIAYMVFRYALEQMGAKKILMIVPAKSLVKQAVGDFNDYAEFFNMETVWAGGELQEGSNVTIGTFQSLVKKADKKSSKYDPHFFNEYDVVLVDEAHTLKCQSIDTILNQSFMKNVKIKFGFSGSLPDEHSIDSFCCHSLMGPTIQDIRSKELMDNGYITPIDITQVYIPHPMTDELKKMYIRCGEYLNSITVTEDYINSKGKLEKRAKKLPVEQRDFTMVDQKEFPLVLKTMKENPTCTEDEYLDYLIDLCKARGSNLLMLEQMLLHHDNKRLSVMENILSNINKNCIVFAHHTSYLNYLYNFFKEKFPNRHVYLITGNTSDKKREQIKENLLTDKGAILCASYGCVGTGLTFKNLDYGIFAQSFKSHIINKQSLGRGLCLADDKPYYYLYDLVDDFPTGRLKSQGVSKLKLYKQQEFKVKSITVS